MVLRVAWDPWVAPRGGVCDPISRAFDSEQGTARGGFNRNGASYPGSHGAWIPLVLPRASLPLATAAAAALKIGCRRSCVTTAPDLRMGRGERWLCRSGAGRAAPEPLSAPPSLGWSLGGQGAGGRAMVTHLPHPPPASLGLGHPALGLLSTHRAVARGCHRLG